MLILMYSNYKRKQCRYTLMGVNGAVILFQHYFSHAGPLSGNVHLTQVLCEIDTGYIVWAITILIVVKI